MVTVSVSELKRQTNKILRRVREKGETVEITYRGKMVARLVPAYLPTAEIDDRVEIQITVDSSQKSEAQEARQALIRAGVVRLCVVDQATHSIKEAEALAAAQIIGAAGSLSDMILADREGR